MFDQKYRPNNNFRFSYHQVFQSLYSINSMSNNLTKRDIVLDIYEKTDFAQKEVRETVQLTLDAIANALSEGRNVELRNFGVFEVQVRKSRIGRNPNKPETDVVIPTRAVIKFKAGKELKAKLKELDVDSLQNGK
ncbi:MULTISPECIES: HU family DNA-binding protein [unclassified Lentimonas]|uniref:HU family DNA-binding protein n=1 Tax=unclassified Lentimonas TaxID=2630993 RepID=UPI002452B3A6|nr:MULTISPECIES: HU family DNA-binding protein [unclassified Lentimonas]